MDSSEFEITAQYPLKIGLKQGRFFILRSNSASEMLIMHLNGDPANNFQTEFGGANCAFEVRRSTEEGIEVYSSSLKSCAPNADYDIFQNFTVLVDRAEGQKNTYDSRKYVSFTGSRFIPNFQGSNLTVNKAAMTEDNCQLSFLNYHVVASSLKSHKEISPVIMWKFEIVKPAWYGL
jgi:hypothetical protein